MRKKKTQLKQQKNRNNYSNIKLFKYLNNLFICLFVFLLPTQLGKHFFFSFSYLNGIRVDYLAPTIYITDILVFILMLINIKQIFVFFRSKYLLLLVGFFLVNIVFSLSPVISLYKFVKIIEVIVIGLIIYQSQINIFYIVLCFLFGSLFELSLAISQLNLGRSLQGFFYYFGERMLSLSMPGIAKASFFGREFLRPYATFSHPNSMAGFYLLLYVFFLSIKNILKPRLLFIIYLLLFISSCLIFISFSKVAIITFLILNAGYLILNTKYCRLCVLARLFVLIIVGSVFMFAHTDPLTIQKRIELVQNSLIVIFQHPLFGTGIGSYLLAQQSFNSQFFLFINQPVHNIFLLLTAELGIPITVIIFIIIINLIKKHFSSQPPHSYLLTPIYYLLTAIFLTGFFDHYWITLQQNMLLLGVVGGLTLKYFDYGRQ